METNGLHRDHKGERELHGTSTMCAWYPTGTSSVWRLYPVSKEEMLEIITDVFIEL